MGRNKGYEGSVTIGGRELKIIDEESLMENITYVSHQSYLFKGTVRENLLMGNPKASDEELWAVLDSLRGLSEILQYGHGEHRLSLMNKQTEDLSCDEERMKRTTGRNQAVTNTVILFYIWCKEL